MLGMVLAPQKAEDFLPEPAGATEPRKMKV